MPLSALVEAMDPPRAAEVLAAADGLRYRDFLTVALVVPERDAFPDNWIYVHAPDVKLGPHPELRLVVAVPGEGRPHLPRPRVLRQRGRRVVGHARRASSSSWARDELQRLGLVEPGVVEAGYVVRMPKAYPVYDAAYAANVDVLRALAGRPRRQRARRSAATACTGTTTRTTRCSRPC